MPKVDPNSDLVLIDKPVGITSFGAVARVRTKLSRQVGRKVKVGHTGTLDPFASGLMILVIGAMCKRAAEFSGLDKSYLATIRLGATTPSLDLETTVSLGGRGRPSRAQVEATLNNFLYQKTQIPPIFSALKIGGRRAYQLAREGKQIKLEPRPVKLHQARVVNYHYPLLEIEIDVSSGYYVRSLARDLGASLGVGGYLVGLRRTRVGQFKVDQAGKFEFDC